MIAESKRNESKLNSILDEIPEGSEVILEGGHLTIEVEAMVPDAEWPGDMTDRLLLIKVAIDTPSLSGEMERIQVGAKGKKQSWALVSVSATQAWHQVLTMDSPGKIYQVLFSPTPTQRESLRLALKCFQSLKDKAHRLQVAILVGNFQLPPELRNRLLERCLPESYRSLFSEYGAEASIQLYSEATCRNRGRQHLLDARRAVLEDRAVAEATYRKYGYALLRVDGAFFLASDLISGQGFLPALVALTKSKGTPTCGLILAGKLLSMARQGFQYFLSFYDLADDNTIQNKNKDGAVIFGHLVSGGVINMTLCTTNTLGPSRRFLKIDRFEAQDFANSGIQSSREHMISDAYHRSPEYCVRPKEGEPATCCLPVRRG